MDDSQLEKLEDKLYGMGYEGYRVRDFCLRAAYKIMPLFTTFNLTYGDRVPDVYYVGGMIEMLVGEVIDRSRKDTKEVLSVSSGMFTITLTRYEDSDLAPELFVQFDLETINPEELATD